MKRFKLLNNIFGWVAFAIAALTYLLTMEPTASFWDCPEFIATAFKFDVGHPPGSPFAGIVGRRGSEQGHDVDAAARDGSRLYRRTTRHCRRPHPARAEGSRQRSEVCAEGLP